MRALLNEREGVSEMIFGSDNLVGASAQVLDALVRANQGALAGYGTDEITRRVEKRFCDLFERDVSVFLVVTGTAANALSLAAAVPPWGMAICHREAHIHEDECGAPEFFTHGAKLAGLPGVAGKMSTAVLSEFLTTLAASSKQMPPKLVSLSQVTEAGTVYTLEEIAEVSDICRRHGLSLHMDGARFANALATLGCSPAQMTWKRGVDIVSFGASKNGCLAAEAIIVFDPDLAKDLEYRRKRSGHTLSKGRLLGAQMEAYLQNDHWLDNARHANAMAALLLEGLAAIPGVRLPWPSEANEVFPIIPKRMDEALRSAGAQYFPWQTGSLPTGESIGSDEILIRLVTSFATEKDTVERFIAVARSAVA